MNKEKLDDHLPPFLEELKSRGDGFKIPQGYFDELESLVFNRLEAGGSLEPPVIRVIKRPGLFAQFIRPQAAMAYAAILVLVLAAVWFVRQNLTTPQKNSFVATELTADDIEYYVLENLHEFEPEQLAAFSAEETESRKENATERSSKNGSTEEIHPDDLEKILDEMTEEELEQML